MKQWSYTYTILKICVQLFPGKDFLQSNLQLQQQQANISHPFDIDTELIECFFIKKDKSSFYDCDFDAGGMLPYWEVHEKKAMWRNSIGLC